MDDFPPNSIPTGLAYASLTEAQKSLVQLALIARTPTAWAPSTIADWMAARKVVAYHAQGGFRIVGKVANSYRLLVDVHSQTGIGYLYVGPVQWRKRSTPIELSTLGKVSP